MFDFNSGYWQVVMEEDDKSKIVFVMCKGLFQFKVMFFGFICVFVIFECLMEMVFVGL